MNLTDARDWVRRAVEDGLDSSVYSNADVDRAIIQAGQYFCRFTKFDKRADNVTLTAGDATFDMTTPVANGFRPERLIDVCLVGLIVVGGGDGLSVIDYTQLNAAQSVDTTQGTPEALAFIDATTAQVWPTPSVDMTAKLRWWQPFTSFTPGTSTTDSVTLNIPDDYLPSVLADGAASVLTAPNKGDKFGGAAGARFMAYCRGMAGAGNFGSKVIYREKLD